MTGRQETIDYDPPPLARKGDPHTSKTGARHIAPREGTIHARILALMEDGSEEHTAREMGDSLGIDGAWKRTAEMEAKGLIRPGKARKCRITGQAARTWMLGDGKPPGS